ncbi:hypothetical protein AQUCO_00700533v1 [Aquilegia coerulea]|uniref:Uncharacterized protein n=1 Tax=Aquilegia coerulea TaxID=218851 RepID=A0A2G5EKJ3_AQUCA|nr:hypothetical protein AQUCO_00700533v1 [Aquilegia coerulea]
MRDTSRWSPHERWNRCMFDKPLRRSTLSTKFMKTLLSAGLLSQKSRFGTKVHKYIHLLDNALVRTANFVGSNERMQTRILSGKQLILSSVPLFFCPSSNFLFIKFWLETLAYMIIPLK